MDVNVILKYRRDHDSWLCSECEVENHISLGRCAVCGDHRSPASPIIKAWSEADEIAAAAAVRPEFSTRPPVAPPQAGPYGGYHARPPVAPPPKDDSNNNYVIWLIVAAIVIVLLIFAATSANACPSAPYDYNVEYDVSEQTVSADDTYWLEFEKC